MKVLISISCYCQNIVFVIIVGCHVSREKKKSSLSAFLSWQILSCILFNLSFLKFSANCYKLERKYLMYICCAATGHYNGEHQDCFNGTVMEKVPGKEPCGYSYIDGVSEKCCDNTVYAVSSHDCCYGKKYIT